MERGRGGPGDLFVDVAARFRLHEDPAHASQRIDNLTHYWLIT